MTKGFIKLYRDILETPLWESEPFSRSQAWIDILLLANYKEKIIFVRGNEIRLKRGQLGWSQERLSQRWKWSKKKTQGFLKLLEKELQITIQKSKVLSVITIANYDFFQQKRATEEPQSNLQNSLQNSPQENLQKSHTLPTNKERKKERKEEEKELLLSKDNICGEFESKKINDEFEKIWKNYLPVKTKDGGFTGKGDKKPALAEFERICKKADDNIFEKISLGVKNYLQECSQTSTRTKHFVRFLKNETWKEYQTLQNQAVICSEDKDEKRFNELMEALN